MEYHEIKNEEDENLYMRLQHEKNEAEYLEGCFTDLEVKTKTALAVLNFALISLERDLKFSTLCVTFNNGKKDYKCYLTNPYKRITVNLIGQLLEYEIFNDRNKKVSSDAKWRDKDLRRTI